MSLDTFFVLDSNGKPIAEDGSRLKFIKEQLTESLSAAAGAPQIMQRRMPRRVKSFSEPTETKISLDEMKQLSVLEVSTPDRPGLLARIGKVFVEFGIQLQAAKIQTLGERVEDVFFITDADERPLTDAELCNALQAAIRQELDEQAAA